MDYSKKLKDPRWQRLRLEIMERDGFRCTRCNDAKSTLHVNHLKYTGDPWEAPPEHLETLCETCHKWRTKINLKFQLTRSVDLLVQPGMIDAAESELPLECLPFDGSDEGIKFNLEYLFYTSGTLTHAALVRGLAEILGVTFDADKYNKGRS
jgi:hypothetical protein